MMRTGCLILVGVTLITAIMARSAQAGAMTPLSDQPSLMRSGSMAAIPAEGPAAQQLLSATDRSTKAAIRLRGMATLGQDFAASALASWLRSPEEILGIIRPDSGNPTDFMVEPGFFAAAGLDPMGLVQSWGKEDALTRLDRLIVTAEGLIGPPETQRVVLPVPADAAGMVAYAKKFNPDSFLRNTNGGNPLPGGNLVPTSIPNLGDIDRIDPDLLTDDNLRTAQNFLNGKLPDAEALPDLIAVPWMRDLLQRIHDVTGWLLGFLYDNRFVLIGFNLFALAMQQLLRRRRG